MSSVQRIGRLCLLLVLSSVALVGSSRSEMREDPRHPNGTGDQSARWPSEAAIDKLIEQLGATLKVENKPADRNSSIFDKVKDIFG